MTRRPLLLLDSISHIGPSAEGHVVVSGSHGGVSAGQFVLDGGSRPYLVLLNDAGVGKDQAGIAALTQLDAAQLACACYGHNSARIGDAQDALANGIISCVNASAAKLGLRPGDSVAQWANTQ